MRAALLASLLVVSCIDHEDLGENYDHRAPAADPGAQPPGAQAPIDLDRANVPLASAISASCGLDAAGGVHCWGSNIDGALGSGASDASFHTDALAAKGLDHGVASIAGGDQTFCAVLGDGSVRCWGNAPNVAGPVPRSVSGLSAIARVAVGNGFACALDMHGAARCWGAGGAGQLGDGNTEDRDAPVLVATPEPLVDIAASPWSGFACAVTNAGKVACWGQGHGGQLGVGDATDRAVPTNVVGVDGAISIALGSGFACTALHDGGVMCWGADDEAQLGGGKAGAEPGARRVDGVKDALALALGERHACALSRAGSVTCWGAAYDGAIPGQTALAPPTEVLSSSFAAIAIAAGYQSTCALSSSRHVRCFGSAGISWSADADFAL
jgi:alpha-tubulin suppressor-like RCC1 family protein